MSEYFIFHFDFGLSPSAPAGALRTFEAFARGEEPNPDDAASFKAGEFLTTEELTSYHGSLGSAAQVLQTGVRSTNPTSKYHVPSPTHQIRFTFRMHDDHYENGGYVLPLAIFDIVSPHGLYCTLWDELNRSRLSFYFKEFDDLILQSLRVPSMAYPLPPDAQSNPEGYLRGWKPADKEGFELTGYYRLTPEERAENINFYNE